MELSLSARDAEGYLILDVAGEIDVYTAPQLRERLIALIEGGARHVIVNLDRVEFLDSTGLGVLVGALKRLRGVEGELILACGQERLLKIFRITGLDRVFTMFGSVDAAMASGHTGPGAGATPGGDADGAPDAAGSAG
jgi:anti-sigma B factor antagonist